MTDKKKRQVTIQTTGRLKIFGCKNQWKKKDLHRIRRSPIAKNANRITVYPVHVFAVYLYRINFIARGERQKRRIAVSHTRPQVPAANEWATVQGQRIATNRTCPRLSALFLSLPLPPQLRIKALSLPLTRDSYQNSDVFTRAWKERVNDRLLSLNIFFDNPSSLINSGK